MTGSSRMPPPEAHVFTPRQIALGPDEIRGQVGSLAFIYTRYPEPDGNRWFVRPGYVGHEQMTNTRGMLQAFFGPKAGEVAEQVVSMGEVYSKDSRGQYASTGATREVWDWRTIRLLAKRESLFGRTGTLCGRQVVMLWGDPPGWIVMLVEVLGHLGIEVEDEVIVVVADQRQFMARDFLTGNRTNRRGFLGRCLGAGAALSWASPSTAIVPVNSDGWGLTGPFPPDLEEYRRIMARTPLMDVVGRPRSWSVVSRGFHPFSPERVVVLPSDVDRLRCGGGFGGRRGTEVRRRIDRRIDEEIEETKHRNPGYEPPEGWFPDSQRESICRIMDVMVVHYGDRSKFEPWVVGLARRELLGSTAAHGSALAHQFQYDGGEVRVDCPPVDWWLFLFPAGIGWSAIDEKPVFAIIAHVARDGEHARRGAAMLPVWCLAGRVLHAVDDDWARVARMGPVEVAWHLNPITAHLLGGPIR
jgi:hypothetical protein